MTNAPKSSRRHLTTTTDEGKINLTEQELSRVTGGIRKAGGSPMEYLKINMTEVVIAS